MEEKTIAEQRNKTKLNGGRHSWNTHLMKQKVKQNSQLGGMYHVEDHKVPHKKEKCIWDGKERERVKLLKQIS